MNWDKLSPVEKILYWYGLAAVTWALHSGLLKLLGYWDVTWADVFAGLWVPLLLAVYAAWMVVLLTPVIGLYLWWNKRRIQRRENRLVSALENVCKHDQDFKVTRHLDQNGNCNATLFCAKCGLQLRHCVTQRSYDARVAEPSDPHPFHWGLALEELKGYHPAADVAICEQIDALYQEHKEGQDV